MLDHDMSMAATRPSDLKLNNRMQILELFKSGAVYSVADLARAVGISRQTVMKAIQFFLEKGILVSDGKADSGSMGGKRAELFTLSSKKYLFDVLVCPNCLYISLFNTRCEVIDDFTCEEIVNKSVDAIIDAAVRACDQLMEQHDISSADVRGVCVTSSGIMEHATNQVKYNSLFPAWGKNVPIADKLAAHFENAVVVRTENVAKVCGSAYLPESRVSHLQEVAVFSRWGGVAACMISNGHILSGKDGLIGEIGHMIVHPDDPEVCACGSRGCFERQVSIERLRKLAEQWAPQMPESTLMKRPISEMTISGVFEASAHGDPLARRLSTFAAKCFAIALRNVMLMFNPDRVVLQGDYAKVDENFRKVLYEQLHAFRFFDEAAGDDDPFTLEMDGRSIQELTTFGAYTLLIDHVFSEEAIYS